MRNKKMVNESYTLPQSCDNSSLANNDSSKNVCSPEFVENLDKPLLAINAAEKLTFSSSQLSSEYPEDRWGETTGPLKVMVASALFMTDIPLEEKRRLPYEIVFTARNIDNGRVYSGKIIDKYDRSLRPAAKRRGFIFDENNANDSEKTADASQSEKSEAELSNKTSPRYYSYGAIDLVKNAGLPLVNAEYHVHAAYKNLVSNMITIEIEINK